MKTLAVLCVLVMTTAAGAQEIEPFLRGFADSIIAESKIAFIDDESGKVVEIKPDGCRTDTEMWPCQVGVG